MGGAGGLARAHDYLLGHPRDVAVLVSVELCSLTLQRDDDSVANFVASGLFGDGAAAVVVAGERRAAELGLPGPEIVGTRSELYPDSESVIGWDIGGTGFRIVLTAAVSDTIDANIGHDVGELLAEHDLDFGDAGEQAVIQRAHLVHEPGFVALQLHTQCHHRTGFPVCEELRNHGGRILEVCGQSDDGIALSLQQPVSRGADRPKVSGVENHLDASVGRCELPQNLWCCVLRAVIDEDVLVPVLGERVKLVLHRLVDRADIRFLIEARRHDGNEMGSHIALW